MRIYALRPVWQVIGEEAFAQPRGAVVDLKFVGRGGPTRRSWWELAPSGDCLKSEWSEHWLESRCHVV